jgi:hypothetical protein
MSGCTLISSSDEPDYRVYFDTNFYNKTKLIKIYHSQHILNPNDLYHLLNTYLINDLANVVLEYIYSMIIGYEDLVNLSQWCFSPKGQVYNDIIKSNILRYLVKDVGDFTYRCKKYKTVNNIQYGLHEYYKIVNGVEYVIVINSEIIRYISNIYTEINNYILSKTNCENK